MSLAKRIIIQNNEKVNVIPIKDGVANDPSLNSIFGMNAVSISPPDAKKEVTVTGVLSNIVLGKTPLDVPQKITDTLFYIITTTDSSSTPSTTPTCKDIDNSTLYDRQAYGDLLKFSLINSKINTNPTKQNIYDTCLSSIGDIGCQDKVDKFCQDASGYGGSDDSILHSWVFWLLVVVLCLSVAMIIISSRKKHTPNTKSSATGGFYNYHT